MNGATTGGVRAVLRIEGAIVLAGSLALYDRFGLGWPTFALAFLAPDLAFFAYLAGARIGALAYNATHSYIGCVVALGAGVLLAHPVLVGAGLIWSAHLGFDRMLGYGLKYAAGFRFTHLGTIGRAGPQG